jgi:hypothetical protein
MLTNFGIDRSILFTDACIENPDRPALGLTFRDAFGEL